MYVRRALESEVLKASEKYPVTMVCGQRQVGKSTMLNYIKPDNMRYVSFDDRNALRLAGEDVDLFFDTFGYPLLIDELQKEHSILDKIKDISDFAEGHDHYKHSATIRNIFNLTSCLWLTIIFPVS